MGTLGKLLLVVNLLAIAGFAYLGVQDWQGRQTIAAGVLRHFLLLGGLPFGDRAGDVSDMPTDPEAEVPFVVEVGGGVPTRSVSPDLLKAYFAPAGGGAAPDGQVALATNAPVPNQLAEVKRVYALVKGEVEKQDGSKAKAVVAGPWLLLQAETYDERAETQGLIAAGNGDELAKRLFTKFDRVLNPPKTYEAPPAGDADPAATLAKTAELRAGGVQDAPERRARAAHLLVHLDPSAAWQKRVMMVVGLRRYVATLADQALRFRAMAERVERLMSSDQEAFNAEYAQLRGLAIQRTQMVRDAAENRARAAEQVRRDTDIVAQRTTALAGLRGELAKVKAEVDDLLARQAVTEAQLFAVQREVGLTLEEIYRLEAALSQTERAAYAPKK